MQDLRDVKMPNHMEQAHVSFMKPMLIPDSTPYPQTPQSCTLDTI